MIQTFHQPGEGIIYAQGKGYIPTDDFRAWNDDMLAALANETRDEVHIIYDARYQQGIELTLSSAVEVFTFFKHQNIQWVLLVASEKEVETQMAGLIAQLFRLNYRVLRTPEQARDFLMDIDDTLIWREVLGP
jgi:hypothetical protein